MTLPRQSNIESVHFDVLPFQLGVTAPESVTGDLEIFYEGICRLLTRNPSCTMIDSAGRPIHVLTGAMIDSADMGLAESLVEEAGRSIKLMASILIVDLANPGVGQGSSDSDIRGSVYPGIAKGLAKLVSEHAELTVMILVREAGRKHSFTHALGSAFDSGRAVLIYDNGEIVASQEFADSWSDWHYRRYLREARGDPLERLKTKLIKMLGWFNVSESAMTTYYARHYYDLSLCGQEIYELLVQQIESITREPTLPNVDLVIVRAKGATGFELSVGRIQFELEIPVVREAILPEFDLSGYRHAIIVVPVLASGMSIAALAGTIRSRIPDIHVSGFAVLSTTGGQWAYQRSYRLVGGRPRTRVRFCHVIEQGRVLVGDPDCAPRTWNLEPSPRDVAGLSNLTAYQFWDLVQCCGFEEERNPPNGRPPRAAVPAISRLIEDYGTWLSVLMWQSIEQVEDVDKSSVIFVCPDNEDNSRVLADRLRKAVGVSVLRVPREAFALVAQIAAKGDSREYIMEVVERRWPVKSYRWSRDLKDSPITKAVVFDDISVSGRTQAQLGAFLEIYGIEVVGYTVVIAYGNSNFEGHEPELRCLYRLPHLDRLEESGLAGDE